MTKADSISDDFIFESPADWNFDSVPAQEVIACCVWEYARESETINLKADMLWCRLRHTQNANHYAQNPTLKKQHDEEARCIQERAKCRGFDYEKFAEDIWETDFPFVEIYESVFHLVGSSALPWQRLPNRMRNALAQKAAKGFCFPGLSCASIRDLEKLWAKNSVELKKIRGTPRDPNDDTEEEELWNETRTVESYLAEERACEEQLTVAFTIDFSRFTDAEITNEFQEWLLKTRPKRWSTPRRVFPGAPQRGRKLTEYRVALERLGLMRLLHWYSPKQVEEEFPKDWARIRKKKDCFRREITGALRFFRKLFPFLPTKEVPYRAVRHGVWGPPVLKAMDEMHREMQKKGGH